VKGLSDLAGKKVGLARATPQDVMTRYLLKSNGLDGKVQYVQTPLADMRNALANGQIDVYCGAEPTPSMDLVEGKGQLVVPSSQLYSTPAHDLNAGLGVSTEYMNQKPDVVKDIVSYHFKANDFMKTHTDAWFAKTSELTGSTVEVCKKAAENITLISAIDDKIVKETQDFATALRAEGYLQGDVDMKKYYTTKFQPK
jgi:ABC-type nitrate/sulfonate/bicarbonate transport system substrate-binding protein